MNTRVLAVSSAVGKSKTSPKRTAIYFSGNWLDEAGFKCGNYVTVDYQDGCLVFNSN